VGTCPLTASSLWGQSQSETMQADTTDPGKAGERQLVAGNHREKSRLDPVRRLTRETPRRDDEMHLERAGNHVLVHYMIHWDLPRPLNDRLPATTRAHTTLKGMVVPNNTLANLHLHFLG
jgi:hypothetical protein